MLFNSFTFFLFFAIVFTLYGALSHRWQNRMLLLASLVFYGWWDYLHATGGRFLFLMLLTASIDYFTGAQLAKTTDAKVRKRWLWVSLASNFGILGYFKYCNFFLENVRAGLLALGLDPGPWALEITLPVGISFYTFQSLSYTIDIYRHELKPARNIFDFLLFVTFFPQLVAGPIERASHLLPQVEEPRRMTWAGWGQGATLILIGLFKKVAVADLLAPLAEKTFAAPESCSWRALLFGLYCFSFQIYADFSGYSDIARGVARMLGFELMENFNHPYFSASITEFWRRWHISLSTWLRDYLYIPLGGNRLGTWRTYLNLFATMLLGGLWHGASWAYVIWGALHGVFLAVHKLLLGERKLPEKPPKKGFQGHLMYLFKTVATFHLVALTWIFFRAGAYPDSFDKASQYLLGILTLRPFSKEAGVALKFDADEVRMFAWALATLLIVVDIPQYWRRDHTVLLRWPFFLKVLALVVLSLWVLLSRRTENVPFIYFQF